MAAPTKEEKIIIIKVKCCRGRVTAIQFAIAQLECAVVLLTRLSLFSFCFPHPFSIFLLSSNRSRGKSSAAITRLRAAASLLKERRHQEAILCIFDPLSNISLTAVPMSAPSSPASARSADSFTKVHRSRRVRPNPPHLVASQPVYTLSPLSAERGDFSGAQTPIDSSTDGSIAPPRQDRARLSSSSSVEAPHGDGPLRDNEPLPLRHTPESRGDTPDAPAHRHFDPSYRRHPRGSGTLSPFAPFARHSQLSPVDQTPLFNANMPSPVLQKEVDVDTQEFQSGLRDHPTGRTDDENTAGPASGADWNSTTRRRTSAQGLQPPPPDTEAPQKESQSGDALEGQPAHIAQEAPSYQDPAASTSTMPAASRQTLMPTNNTVETVGSCSEVPAPRSPPLPTSRSRPAARPRKVGLGSNEFRGVSKTFYWNGLPSSSVFEPSTSDDCRASGFYGDPTTTFLHLEPLNEERSGKYFVAGSQENASGMYLYGSKSDFGPPERKKGNFFSHVFSLCRSLRANMKAWSAKHVLWIAVLLALVTVGNFLQIIMLNFWLASFPETVPASNYTVFALPGVIFLIFFFLVQIVYLILQRPNMSFAKSLRGNWLLFLIGLTDSVNSWMAAYAATYTSEVLQALFMNLSPIFAVFLSKWILRDDRKYMNKSIIAVFVLTIVGVFIVTIYTMVRSPSFGEIAWISIFFLSIPLRVLMNVWQSLYMIVYTYDSAFNEWLERKYVEEEVENAIRQQRGDLLLSKKVMRRRRRKRRKRARQEELPETKSTKLSGSRPGPGGSGTPTGTDGSAKAGHLNYNTSEDFTMSATPTPAEGFSGTFSVAHPVEVRSARSQPGVMPRPASSIAFSMDLAAAGGLHTAATAPALTAASSGSFSRGDTGLRGSGRANQMRRRKRRSHLDLNLSQAGPGGSLTSLVPAVFARPLGRPMSSSTINQLPYNNSDPNMSAAGENNSQAGFSLPALPTTSQSPEQASGRIWAENSMSTLTEVPGRLRIGTALTGGDDPEEKEVSQTLTFTPKLPGEDGEVPAFPRQSSGGAFYPRHPVTLTAAGQSRRQPLAEEPASQSRRQPLAEEPASQSRQQRAVTATLQHGEEDEEYDYEDYEESEEDEEESHDLENADQQHILSNKDPCSVLEGMRYYRELDSKAVHDVLRSGASEVVFRGEEREGNRLLRIPAVDEEEINEILDYQRHQQEQQRRRQGRVIGIGTGIQLGGRKKAWRPYDPARQITPFQKHYRDLQDREGDDTSVKVFMLSTDTFWQLVVTLMLLPADALPWFGYSTSVRSTWNNFMDGIACVFTKGDNTLWGFLYTLGFVFNYLGAAYLNHYSVALCSIVTQLSSPFTALMLVIIPSWNKHPEDSPPWFLSLVSIVLLSVAALIYVLWEEKTDEEKKEAEMQLKRYKLKLSFCLGSKVSQPPLRGEHGVGYSCRPSNNCVSWNDMMNDIIPSPFVSTAPGRALLPRSFFFRVLKATAMPREAASSSKRRVRRCGSSIHLLSLSLSLPHIMLLLLYHTLRIDVFFTPCSTEGTQSPYPGAVSEPALCLVTPCGNHHRSTSREAGPLHPLTQGCHVEQRTTWSRANAQRGTQWLLIQIQKAKRILSDRLGQRRHYWVSFSLWQCSLTDPPQHLDICRSAHSPHSHTLSLPTPLTVIIFVVGVALCSIFFMLFIITCLVSCCFGGKKSNKRAPTSSKKPITFVCIDVDQSVLLWTRDRAKTAHAIHTYNCIVRGLIGKYNCYEWWSSGSGLFMVATSNAVNALTLVQHLQHRMMQEPADKFFDNVYIELEIKRQKEDPTKLATSAFAPDYDLIWNGLRVCIGLHTCTMEVLKDPITGYVDYGGQGGKIAYEVCQQAHGGQTLMTRATYEETFMKHKSLQKKFKVKDIVDDGQLDGVPSGEEVVKTSKKMKISYLPHPYLLRLPSSIHHSLLYELVTVARREFPVFPRSGYVPLYEYVTLISEIDEQRFESEEAKKERARQEYRRFDGRASQYGLRRYDDEPDYDDAHPYGGEEPYSGGNEGAPYANGHPRGGSVHTPHQHERNTPEDLSPDSGGDGVERGDGSNGSDSFPQELVCSFLYSIISLLSVEYMRDGIQAFVYLKYDFPCCRLHIVFYRIKGLLLWRTVYGVIEIYTTLCSIDRVIVFSSIEASFVSSAVDLIFYYYYYLYFLTLEIEELCFLLSLKGPCGRLRKTVAHGCLLMLLPCSLLSIGCTDTVDHSPVLLAAAIAVDETCGVFRFTKIALAGFILLAFGLIFMALFFVFYCCCCHQLSGIDTPPHKAEADGEMTIICTRIYGEAWLWDRVPDKMKRAVEEYVHLIRELTAKYKLYEVSYYDGRFTIAADDALKATAMVTEISTALMQHQWSAGTVLDETYIAVEKEMEIETQGQTSLPTAHLSPPKYVAQWNGLRVSVGMSTGQVYVKRSWGGTFVFMGAPTAMAEALAEIAKNGQVLVTDRTYRSVMKVVMADDKTTEDRLILKRFVRLCTATLFNFAHVSTIYQLNTIEGRNYGGIHIHIESPEDVIRKKRQRHHHRHPHQHGSDSSFSSSSTFSSSSESTWSSSESRGSHDSREREAHRREKEERRRLKEERRREKEEEKERRREEKEREREAREREREERRREKEDRRRERNSTRSRPGPRSTMGRSPSSNRKKRRGSTDSDDVYAIGRPRPDLPRRPRSRMSDYSGSFRSNSMFSPGGRRQASRSYSRRGYHDDRYDDRGNLNNSTSLLGHSLPSGTAAGRWNTPGSRYGSPLGRDSRDGRDPYSPGRSTRVRDGGRDSAMGILPIEYPEDDFFQMTNRRAPNIYTVDSDRSKKLSKLAGDAGAGPASATNPYSQKSSYDPNLVGMPSAQLFQLVVEKRNNDFHLYTLTGHWTELSLLCIVQPMPETRNANATEMHEAFIIIIICCCCFPFSSLSLFHHFLLLLRFSSSLLQRKFGCQKQMGKLARHVRIAGGAVRILQAWILKPEAYPGEATKAVCRTPRFGHHIAFTSYLSEGMRSKFFSRCRVPSGALARRFFHLPRRKSGPAPLGSWPTCIFREVFGEGKCLG
eukprot:gene8564-6005_t